MPTLNERLNEAIEAYATVAGLKADNFWDQSIVKDLNTSRHLDSTGITTFMMLHGLLQGFFSDTSFTVQEILGDYENFLSTLSSMRAVTEHMTHPDVMSQIDAVTAETRALVSTMGASSSEMEEALQPGVLGFLRRDVLRSIKTLTAVQFTHGEPSSEPVQANGRIFEFWNINSLLRLLQQQSVSGATLCLIRDPDEVMASYFVFAVKHGDAITVLTDREAVPHPAHYRMSRRPDRTLERRAARHHFPYQLLDLESTVGSQGQANGLRAKARTALVRQQTEMAPIGTLSDLPADQMLWAAMVLTHIATEYGRGNRKLETAYTGEMVVTPETLVSKGSLVHQRGHELLTLAPLTRADVTAETTAPQWQRPANGQNEWMIEHYGKVVPDEALNPVGHVGLQKLLAAHSGLLTRETRDPFSTGPQALELETLEPTNFGTKAEIERDRLWVARMNQCRIVQRAVEDDYEQNKKRVCAWYGKQLSRRLPFLLEAAARGELMLPSMTYAPWAASTTPGRKNTLTQVTVKRRQDLPSSRHYAFSMGRVDERASFGYRCAVNTTGAATVFSVIEPDCPQALAELLGLAVTELPIQLQHWAKYRPYRGNSILDRIDPSDWVLSNPWDKLVLKVLLPLSKTAYNAERKRLGLSRPSAA